MNIHSNIKGYLDSHKDVPGIMYYLEYINHFRSYEL